MIRNKIKYILEIVCLVLLMSCDFSLEATNGGETGIGDLKVESVVQTEGFCYNLLVKGNDLLVADGSNGILFYDIENKNSPVKYDQIYIEDVVYSLKTDNNGYLYAASGNSGVKVIDLDLVGGAEIVYNLNITNAVDIEIIDNYLYVITSNNGLNIYNIENPEFPYKVEENIYTILNMSSILYDNNLLYIGVDREVVVFDISDPYNVSLKETIILNSSVDDIDLLNDKLLITSAKNIYVYEYNNNAYVQTNKVYFYYNLNSIYVNSTYLCCALKGNSGIEIYNSNGYETADDLVRLRFYSTNMNAMQIQFQNNYIYVANGVYGFKIFSI